MFNNFTKNQYKFIVYSSYFTVLTSAVWLGLNIINEGWGGIGTGVPLLSGVVFYFYGRYFEGMMNNTEG